MATPSQKVDQQQPVQFTGILKSAAAMSLLTIVSRILGLIRDIVQAAFLGTSAVADAFRVSTLIPNLLRRLLSEGAMTAAFVPTFAEVEKNHDKERLWRFVSTFFCTFALILAAVVIIGEFAAPLIVDVFTSGKGFEQNQEQISLTVYLTRITFPYIAFISLSAVVMAVLNSLGTFAPSAFTPALFNIIIIVSAISFAVLFDNAVTGLAVGFLVGGVFQLLFQLPFLKGRGIQFKPAINFTDPYVLQVFKLMIPGLFAVGITQINMVINTRILSGIGEGALAGIYYANRLTELTQGIFAVSVATVILPLMSRQAKAGNYDEMKQSISFGLRMIIFITVPAAAGLAILRDPIVSILFQRGEFDAQSLALTAGPLLYFSAGLLFFAIVRVMVPAFYAMKMMHIPVMVSFVDMVTNVSLALWLSTFMGNSGVALAMSAGAIVNVTLLLVIFVAIRGPLPVSGIIATILRTVIAAGVMSCVCYLGLYYLDLGSMDPGASKAIASLGVIVIAVIVFFAISLALRSPELRELRNLIARRKKKIEA